MSGNDLIQHSKRWDRTGLFIAGLCLIHCLSLPFLIILIPSLEFVLENPLLEAGVLIAGILVGGSSFLVSFRKHRQKKPIVWGFLGVSFLLLSLLVGHNTHSHGDTFDWFSQINFLTILGGLFLMVGHIGNINACHCFCDDHCHDHSHDEPTHPIEKNKSDASTVHSLNA